MKWKIIKKKARIKQYNKHMVVQDLRYSWSDFFQQFFTLANYIACKYAKQLILIFFLLSLYSFYTTEEKKSIKRFYILNSHEYNQPRYNNKQQQQKRDETGTPAFKLFEFMLSYKIALSCIVCQ